MASSSDDLWGPRPRGAPTLGLYADVLLSDEANNEPPYPGLILEALKLSHGLRISYLARVCRVWRSAVARRVGAWQAAVRFELFAPGVEVLE